ncbi:MAG: cytochrome c [Gammaproteobacteria bacterium]|nr:cytochrome c [Gammaproteobacteria bacterium]
MFIKIRFLLFVFASVVSLAPAAMADGDAQAGEQKAETCIGCHGIAGYKNTYPSFRVPKLRGQHADYIIAALKAYRAQERKHPTMRAQAGPLTDQDIEDIAAYIASLK